MGVHTVRNSRLWSSVFLIGALPAAAAAQEVGPEFVDKAKAELDAAIRSGKVEGAIHLVSRDGKVVYLGVAGVSDVEVGKPLRPDAIFRIYSMTKPITSAAAMLLYDRGKFGLDDPVSQYIPAFKNAVVLGKPGESPRTVPVKRPITIRDVLSHTTGYSYGKEPPYVTEHYEREGMLYRPPMGMLPPSLTIEAAAEALARIPVVHQPGERFTYGFNTDLLGRLIEVWSGRTLDEQLRTSLFEPLEMKDTGFSVSAANRGRLVSCHQSTGGKLAVVDKGTTSPFNDGFEFLSGGGGLLSTVQDYANFCQMLVDKGQFKRERLLREETIQLMFTDQLHGSTGNFRFGLGFAINDVELGSGAARRKVAEYSWAGYASTAFRIVPEARLFQIVLRQYVPNTHDLSGRLIATIYEGVR